MANTITTQTLLDGDRNAVIKIHIVSDGTAESNTQIVDVSGLSNLDTNVATGEVRLDKVKANLSGFAADLHWDATSNVDIMSVPDGESDHDFKRFGGLANNAGAGKTGDVLMSLRGNSAGDEGTIVLEMVKKP